jgi:hypothetical protein
VEAVEGDALFRMAERFSSLKTCPGRAKRAAIADKFTQSAS